MNSKVVYIQPYYSCVVKNKNYFNGVTKKEGKRGNGEMGEKRERELICLYYLLV